MAALAEAVQEVTGENVEVGFVDQGYTGARRPRLRLGRASGWRWSNWRRLSMASCCCPAGGWWSAPLGGPVSWLVKDYERLPETVAGLHLVAFSVLMLARIIKLLMAGSA